MSINRSNYWLRTKLVYVLLLIPLLLIPMLLIPKATLGGEQVYRVVDDNGKVTYTDSPGASTAEKVKVPQANVVPATTPRARPQVLKDNGIPTEYQVQIVNPLPETHLNPGDWNLSISVSTNPGVHPEHHLEILVDGEVKSSKGQSVVIENIFRGTHTVKAQVLDDSGQVLGASDTVQVYVHRPTLNSPARR